MKIWKMIFHAFNIPTLDEDTSENLAKRSEKAELLRGVKETAEKFIESTQTNPNNIASNITRALHGRSSSR